MKKIIRAIGSLFFAFFIIVVGTYVAPNLVIYDKHGFMLIYCLSIVISAFWIVFEGIGLFDEDKERN